MGHANISNLSDFFIRRLFAKGKLSIHDCVQAMLKKKVTYNASEGTYEGEDMLSMGTDEAVRFLVDYDAPPGETVLDKLVSAVGGKFTGPIIIPAADLTAEQQRVLQEWGTDSMAEWDCGDDGSGGEYGALDSIPWKFAPGWRNKYPEIPRLGSVTH